METGYGRPNYFAWEMGRRPAHTLSYPAALELKEEEDKLK